MNIPEQYQEFLELSPQQIQELCDEMAERPLDSSSIELWLEDGAKLAALFQECMARLDNATAVNTADEAARQRQAQYRETIWPIGHRFDQALNERLQAHHDLMPAVLLEAEARWSQAGRLNQSQAAIDLLNREGALLGQYAETMGKQTIPWEGEQISEAKLWALMEGKDRASQERAWRAIRERHAQDRDVVGRIWSELIDTRSRLAEVNGFGDYLAYRWVEQGRTDYTPDDSRALDASVLAHLAPIHLTLANAQKERLNVESLRPWDPDAPPDLEYLRPFDSPNDLLQKTINVYRRMDPEFGAYVEKLRDMGLIDLSERSNTTTAGGFSRAVGRHGNFIFMNIRRTRSDVVGLIHEIGHAIANHASAQLPYPQLWGFPADFVETPSTAMEMLTQSYWDEFYTPPDLQRVRREYFRESLHATLFECALDAFQHWVYHNPQAARNCDNCDAQWHDLINRFLPGTDWTGIEQLDGMGWQRMSLNFYMPFYALEYTYGRFSALKLLALPQDDALHRYKSAIALGSSTSTKGLFAALGVDFPFTEADVVAAAQTISARL